MRARSADNSTDCPHLGHYAEDVLKINTMRILGLIKYTAGGMHGWYATDKGFPVRKPNASIGEVESEMEIIPIRASEIKKESLWRRIWNILRSYFPFL